MLQKVEISNRENGWRLDKFATEVVPNSFSRTQIQDYIKSGYVLVNSTIRKPSYKIKTGDIIEFNIPEEPEQIKILPEPLELDIIYEDNSLLVVNKPAGMIVHPTGNKKSGTLVNALLYHYDEIQNTGKKHRPGIVHRLDKETSGAIVVAKNDQIHEELSLQFKKRLVKKQYLALVDGIIKHEGTIKYGLKRHPVNRLKMKVSEYGKKSETHFKRIRTFGDVASMVIVMPKTGRTHQIRLHMKEFGHPVIGDKLYAKTKANRILSPDRHMLHALTLSFIHPVKDIRISFTASVPEDMIEMIKALIKLERNS
ncbi:MAG: RluA family pseudouridine synthase [Kosmotoga sp.]|nr:MAG: RluA family pseudouridine synthase [Kosmotoga sp.]